MTEAVRDRVDLPRRPGTADARGQGRVPGRRLPGTRRSAGRSSGCSPPHPASAASLRRPAGERVTADYGADRRRARDRIGPYKLMEQIGEGGMGLVFVAEQQHPVRRKVALKIIKPGMDTRDVIARFEAERQALALMDHPTSPACSTPARPTAAALLRDGAGPGDADHRVLRRAAAQHPGTAGAVRRRLPGRPARALQGRSSTAI